MPCDFQEEILIIQLELMQGPSKMPDFTAFNTSKDGFYFSHD